MTLDRIAVLALCAGVAPNFVGEAATQSLAVPGFAAEREKVSAAPTFYADVLPVFRENCVACHGPDTPSVGGRAAPMSLTTYDEARRWAARIGRAVRRGSMPPWGAHEQHRGTFKGERYLDPDDKATILAWVDSGAPRGDPEDAPSPTDAGASRPRTAIPPSSGWWIGEPDLVVELAEPTQVADDVEDWRPTFQMPVPEGKLTEARWVAQAELRAGGPWVHHIVSSHMGVGVPGRGPFTYPPGWGVLLPPDPFITVNMHYHKAAGPGTAVEDRTQAAFRFHERGEVIDYVVETDLNYVRNFRIPAGDPSYEVRHERRFDTDTYLLAMAPHMHYRGKAMKYELVHPSGAVETLLWVPEYDFDWQFLYEYVQPKLVPAGSTLRMTWWFDNSGSNPHNPDPAVDVVYGPATTDEMANARIYFAPARPRGLVVGEEVPPELLARARADEERRRRFVELDRAVH